MLFGAKPTQSSLVLLELEKVARGPQSHAEDELIGKVLKLTLDDPVVLAGRCQQSAEHPKHEVRIGSLNPAHHDTRRSSDAGASSRGATLGFFISGLEVAHFAHLDQVRFAPRTCSRRTLTTLVVYEQYPGAS